MKRLLILIVFLSWGSIGFLTAQVPDSTNYRLYLLCKTWGYFKYFSQYKCELQWDTLLNTTVNQVLVADDNKDFNAALMGMFGKVGNNVNSTNPYPWPDTNLNYDNSWIYDPAFLETTRDFLDTFSVHIAPDTSACLVSFNDYSTPGYYSYINFLDDPLSETINLTNEANRLTYMFYYWNIIEYFFPYRYLMDQPWDSTLYQFIPQFRMAVTAPDFHITFLRMVTMINDTHGSTGSSTLTSYLWGGSYLPKIWFTRVDTNCVVTKVQGIPGVSRGDILTALKGIPIKHLEDSLSRYIPSSTPAALYRDLYYKMMLGVQYTNISMTLSDSNNNSYTVSAQRVSSATSWYAWKDDNGLTSSYFITDCDYGYVHMGMLMPEEVPSMYEALKDAPAIIFDIRNYPNGTLWDLGPLLFPGPITSAIYHSPALMPYSSYLPGWYEIGNDQYNLGNWFNPDAYNGNIYILVNEETQSQAEYTCQYISHHPNAEVIGSQSAGADGNVSYLSLPSGIMTYFTSLGWYYDDGYQQQRNGVKIDSVVTRTIPGIRQGRDEVLEAALDCLTGVSEPLRAESLGLRVYPNPASRQLTVSSQQPTGNLSIANCRLSIVDLFGRVVKEIPDINIPCKVDVSDLPDGIYLLRMNDGSGIESTAKFVKAGR